MKTKSRLFVMDKTCDEILNRVPDGMKSVYVRNAIHHYNRWQVHGSTEFNDTRLNKYGTKDVNLRVSELEDEKEWAQARGNTWKKKYDLLAIDMEALMATRESKRLKKWWHFFYAGFRK